ncbi:hypothetical protein Tco_0001026 [Tanacetum coccineum]
MNLWRSIVFHPEAYLRMPGREFFLKGVEWLARGHCCPTNYDAHPLETPADAARKLTSVLMIHPAAFIKMNNRLEFVDGLRWLANEEGVPRFDNEEDLDVD